MSCCKAMRALSHVGFVVENVLLYEDCRSQLFALNCETKTNVFNIVLFTIFVCYGLLYKLNFIAKVFRRSQQTLWNMSQPYFMLTELPDHSDIFWIQPNWEQASFMPLLYIKAVPGNFPLWKPRMAAAGICLHFRAYEGLHCSYASSTLRKCI